MVGRYGATVVGTGKNFDLELVHVWTIENGKVKRFLISPTQPKWQRRTLRSELGLGRPLPTQLFTTKGRLEDMSFRVFA
jgi:hypothetical protein